MKNKSLKHWLVLIACCGLAASSIGICCNSVGVFYSTVSSDLGVLKGTFALHATFSQLATACVALSTPSIMKKYNHKLVFLIGSLLAAIATFLMGHASNMLQFYILGIIRGIGCGLFSSVGITMIINNWFVVMHGLATSIVLSFSGVAGAICSPLFTKLIGSIGWHKTYMVMGVMIFVLCIPTFILPYSFDPRKDNLLPYGLDHEPVKKQRKESTFNRKNIAYIALIIMAFLHPMIAGIAQHLPSYALSIGQEASVGALLLSIVMIGNILFKLIIGFLSDRLGVVKSVIIMIITNMIALILFLVGHSAYAMYIASFIYGSVYSVGAVGLALLTKYFFGVNNYTKAFPIVSSATSIGSALALTVIGYIYDFLGSYQYAFMAAIGIHIIDLCIIGFILYYMKLTKENK